MPPWGALGTVCSNIGGEEGSFNSGKHSSLSQGTQRENYAVLLYKIPSFTHQKHIQSHGIVLFHAYFELCLRNKRIKIKQEMQKDPQRTHTDNFLMNSPWCSCCSLPNSFLGLCHGHSVLVQHPAIKKIRSQIKASDWTFLKLLFTTAMEKGRKTFEKVLLPTENESPHGKQQGTVHLGAPDYTISTQITEFHTAVIYLHFLIVSSWSDKAKIK